MRVGIGYDVHRMVEGRPLVLGGVEIPFAKGLLGHSDADVLVHAIMDALLGAAAMGDIGKHFPDTDPQFKDISSLALLEKVGDLLRSAGYLVANIDAVVIAEAPKIAPYIQEMRKKIASGLQIPLEVVSVKATTTEGLGFVGAGQGIAAQAVCLLEREVEE